MKLTLGTVQFGLKYGISNRQDHAVLPSEARSILERAIQSDISMIDTASQYGNSEQLLGELPETREFQIVTKTPAFRDQHTITKSHGEVLKTTFKKSLQLLKQEKCYGLLIHCAQDLLKNGSNHLMNAMLDLQNAGLIDRVGVSVYTKEEIDQLMDRYHTLNIIQLPLNVLDQRLINHAYLEKLKASNIEIHVRSIFLQGLLLMNLSQLNSFFLPIKSHLQKYQDTIAEHQLTPLEAAILFVKQLSCVDKIIVGVTSVTELDQIIQAYIKTHHTPIDFSFAAIKEEQFLNPVQWSLV